MRGLRTASSGVNKALRQHLAWTGEGRLRRRFGNPRWIRPGVAPLVLTACLLVPRPSLAWGWPLHQLINRSATTHLPEEFRGFAQWAIELERLATEADGRARSDPDEAIRHYIDIDVYDAFFLGTLPHSYAETVERFGEETVRDNGILPWAIEAAQAELVQSFRQGDWPRAVATAADLGHYVADCHQPLHLTRYYDGESFSQRGIHSRYESAMTESHLSDLDPDKGPVYAYARPLESVFESIQTVYSGVHLVLHADSRARSIAGGSSSSATYYDVLWRMTGDATRRWVRDASLQVAALWYTAWLDAGAPALPGDLAAWHPASTLRLPPNVPNPFNPQTTIRFEAQEPGPVSLRILDVRGRLVRQLYFGAPGRGERSLSWNGLDEHGREVPSGIYRLRLEQSGHAVERRAALVR